MVPAPFVRTKLSIMMFLEFFIWGAWLPKLYTHLTSLGFEQSQISWVFAAFNIGSITAMFFSTQFVDRNFAAEKFLAISQFIGGLAMLGLSFVSDFPSFFGLMLLHCLFYVPTISITNSIAFANMRDPQHDFGPIRLWGTIGWIAASVPFVFLLADTSKVSEADRASLMRWLQAALTTPKTGDALIAATRNTFLVSGIASLLLAAFSLLLPHTPPKPAAVGENKLAWLEAAKLLRLPFMFVLFVVTFFDAAVHQLYFLWTEGFLQKIGVPANWTMTAMTLGQFAEIGTMAVLGLVLKRLGWRITMTIGVLGHAIRFGVFAFAPHPAPAVAINIVHGICYAFFFATVYIFVDEFFPKDARASAQGLFNLLILGIGPLAGVFIAPMLMTRFTVDGVVDYRSLFLVPAGVALGASLGLLALFRPPARSAEVAAAPALAH